MELGAEEIAMRHDCREQFAMVSGGDGLRADGEGVAVHEVSALTGLDSIEQRRGDHRGQSVPSHVRHRTSGQGRESSRRTRNCAQTMRASFLGRFVEQLHPEADAEQRLCQARYELVEAVAMQPRHRVSRSADSREYYVAGSEDSGFVARDFRLHLESFECVPERCGVGATVFDDDDTSLHSTPLLLGSSDPCWWIAWRSARPTPLKQASIM